MQSISSRIWTRVAVSISYDDNHYTMGTSNNSYNSIKDNAFVYKQLNDQTILFQTIQFITNQQN